MQRQIRTGRFRWRLTVAFVLVSGVSAAVVAFGSFVTIRQEREELFRERSLREAELGVSRGRDLLSPSSDLKDVHDLVSRYKRRDDADVVMITRSQVFSSNPDIGTGDVPSALGQPLQLEELPTVEVEVHGQPYLVTGAILPNSDDIGMYFFFSRRALTESLSRLLTILLRDWAAVVLLAALVGTLLARRTLQPVARASEAARSLAEGLLDTRLAVDTKDEFGAWAASFNEMAEALQEKIVALSEAHERERRFTSDVAHELRTPLTALVSSASLAEQRLDQMSAAARWCTEQMINEVTRLRSLVEELLEISRLDAGSESIRVESFDIATFVAMIIKGRGWKDHVRLEADPLMIWSDRRRLERIVSNLIGNAVLHGGQNVRVGVREAGRDAVIDVVDDGPGIPREHLPHLFSRFYKLDPTRSGGSGLGLSIALENAKLLGGSIEVQSAPGQGTTFTLRLRDAVVGCSSHSRQESRIPH